MRSIVAVLISLFALTSSACGGPPPASCGAAGAHQACNCASGASGDQVCQSDGTYSACVCDGVDGGNGGTDAGPPPDACAAPSMMCGNQCVDTSRDALDCGACGHACALGQSCSAGACACPAGQTDCGGFCAAVASSAMCPPRLIAPMSSATVTSQRPTLHLAPNAAAGAGTHVDVCSDAACAHVEQGIDATGSVAVPASDLPRGVHFWRARAAGATAYGPTWEFWVGARSAPVDTSWGTVLDANRDGFADIVVGSQDGLYSYSGGANGLGTTPTAVPMPPGELAPTTSATRAGDVNGDGFGDVVTVSGLTLKGYLYFGSASGLGAMPVSFFGTLDVPLSYLDAISAGDINGDGYADLIKGEEEKDTVLVYYGAPSGYPNAPTVLAGTRGSKFGHSVAVAGDVNGDGFADVVVGIPGSPDASAALYLGSANGLSTTATMLRPSGFLQYGEPVAAAGDVNGDGYADFAIGDAALSQAVVYFGSAAGIGANDEPQGLRGPAVGGEYGFGLDGVGDADGDGYADLLIAARGLHEAFFYPGGAMGLASMYTVTIDDPTGGAGDRVRDYATFIRGVGDVDGDGFTDAVVGVDFGGAVYLYSGSAAGIVATPITLANPAGSSSFGNSISSRGRRALPRGVHTRRACAAEASYFAGCSLSQRFMNRALSS